MALGQSNTLEIFDLDGTCNEIDVQGALEGKGSAEVRVYLEAAARFVAAKIPSLNEAEVFDGIKAAMKVIFPDRAKFENWASFPTADKNTTRVCPAVDHFLLTPLAVKAYLSTCPEAKPFLESDWKNDLYQFCSSASLPHAEIDDDAKGALDDRLSRDALMVILTNSKPSKALQMLKKAGYSEDRLVGGGAQRGKIGVIGDGRKFEVDTAWSGPEQTRYGNSVDLSHYFGEGTVLPLGRRHFHETLVTLMRQSGAEDLWMASDIPELDLWPLRNWPEFHAQIAMRRNPTSSQESINALTGSSIPLSISGRLSVLTNALRPEL